MQDIRYTARNLGKAGMSLKITELTHDVIELVKCGSIHTVKET